MKSCPTCHSTYPSDFALCPRDGASLVDSGGWAEGMLVRGKYLLLSQLPPGGMAIVYKALHQRFNELRALKVMKPELATDQSFVKRFMHEAVITRRLQHPNVVRVEDIDESEDGRPFIVMEYIEGQSLKELIQREAPLAVPRVCSIVKQVASALDAAHRLGMIHRDIKPANIVLVSAEGLRQPPGAEEAAQDEGRGPAGGIEIAKVLDFGIAKIKEAHLEDSRLRLSTVTDSGMVVGTPAYMSPEQAMGKRGEELDGRADLYSLGIVMYQMITGELPLKADSGLLMLMAQIHTVPPDIRTRRSGIPEPIAALVMQCLEKDRNRRPGSGHAVIEQIEYWEEEPARLARAKAEQERLARERAEAKRAEREKAERERLAQEMADGAARIKAERERAVVERAERDRLARETAEATAEIEAEPDRPAHRRARTKPTEQSPEAEAGAESALPLTPLGLPWPTPPAARPVRRPSTGDAVKHWVQAKTGAIVALLCFCVICWYLWPVAPKTTSVMETQSSDVSAGSSHPTSNSPASGVSLPPAPHVGSPPTSTWNQSAAGMASPQTAATVDESVPEKRRHSSDRVKSRSPTRTEAVRLEATRAADARKRADLERQVKSWVAIADIDFHDGVYDEAISKYEKALKADPAYPGLKEKLDHARRAKDALDSLPK